MTEKKEKRRKQTEKKQKERKVKTRKTGAFYIWLKRFFMKWRFRLDQARSIFGLLTFAALLATGYVEYITFFDKMDFWGLVLFSLIIFIIFLIGGYAYDRILKLWSETAIVSVERNPYTYVPAPKERYVILGWWAYTFSALKQIAEKLDVELEGEEMIRQQLIHYNTLSPEKENFIVEANKIKKLTAYIVESYIESEEVEDFDEFLKDLELFIKKRKGL